MIDLLEPEVFREKLEKGFSFNKKLIETMSGELLNQTIEETYKTYLEYGKTLSKYITDISVELFDEYKSGKKILFEGAQGISPMWIMVCIPPLPHPPILRQAIYPSARA